MTRNNGRVLRGIALAVLGFAVCAAALVQAADQKTITLVHLSDVHMRPGFNAPERFRLALRDVRSRKPALIINTGDTVDGCRLPADGAVRRRRERRARTRSAVALSLEP
jgi:predicted MPP superfamily phosphohydrolase